MYKKLTCQYPTNRFYTALALQELVNETPINVVAVKFKCSRGMLQSLQQMASTFAGIVTSFCSSLQWDTLTLIVSQFKERLYFGIHRDLIDLMRIPDLNHKRARALFDAGITNLVELANSDVLSVEKILFNVLSFDSEKQHDNENAVEAAQRNEARKLYITGKAGITVGEAAKLLVQEARQFVQYEIGVGNINWSLRNENDNNDTTAENEIKDIHMSYEESKFQTERKNKSKEFLYIETFPSKTNVNEIKKTNTEMPNDAGKSTKNNNNNVAPHIANHLDIDGSGNTKSQKISEGEIEQTKDTKTQVTSNVKKINQNCFEVNNGKYKKEEQKQTAGHVVTKNTISNSSSSKNNIEFKNQIQTTKSNVEISNSDKPKTNSNYGRDHIQDRTEIIKNNAKLKEKKDELKIDAHKSSNRHQMPMSPKNNAKQVENNPKSNTIRTPEGTHTTKITPPVKRKSSEQLVNQIDCTSPKLSKESNNLKPNVYDDEKPSTSKKSQRLLRAQQLSNMKKQEWAKRKDSKDSQQHNDLEVGIVPEHKLSDKSSEKTETKPDALPGSIKILNNNYLSEKSPNTPRTKDSLKGNKMSNEKALSKIPRRSPRNLISSTRIEHASSPANHTPPTRKTPLNLKQTVRSPDELFGDENEEPFIFNTGVNEALKNADNFKVPSAKTELNKSLEDEIPNSQNVVDDVPVNKTNSPHSSRFLRSLRTTQRMQSPKILKKPDIQKKLPPPEPKSKVIDEHVPVDPPTSSSIELTDISMENSLMKNPIHLNASHILSCSKIDTDSSSFQSIDIIDICGNQQLFKEAFKEFMANRRLGFCLGISQQSSKRKPIIGGNLLLNQVAYAEKDSEHTQRYEFQIDDTNYLSGIGFCITDNIVYYMNMQPEGTCKGLTGEIKCKYLRMLLRSSEHSLLIYDAKEQLKVLRRLLNDLGDISVSLEDPKVANWLLQPDKMHNLHSLVN